MDAPIPYPAVATIIAALIAGGIAFLASVLSKEQKTSEFRQSWVDALREDISKFIGSTEVVLAMIRFKAARDGADQAMTYMEAVERDLREITGIYYRIRLRLNPKEHKALLTALENLQVLFAGRGQVLDPQHIDSLVQNIDQISHVVLKKEWIKVKRGEIAFLVFKYGALAVLVAAAIMMWGYFSGHVVIQWKA